MGDPLTPRDMGQRIRRGLVSTGRKPGRGGTLARRHDRQIDLAVLALGSWHDPLPSSESAALLDDG